jgi:dCTP deaminase
MATQPGLLAPGILPYQAILELCGLKDNDLAETQSEGPIQPCRRKNVRSASYDLRLGPHFHFTAPSGASSAVGELRVSHLSEGTSEHIVLPPNQVVVVSCLEKICLPQDMVGHLTLKQDILLQGLIMASQSQIDAGYHGWIYPLFYNLTDSQVMLKLDQSVIRLELVRLPEHSARPYDGDYQGSNLAKSLKHPIGSGLAALREDIEQRGQEVDEARRRIDRTRVAASVVAFLLTIAALAFPFATGLVGEVHSTRDRVSRLEGEMDEPLKLEGKVARLELQTSALQCRVLELEGQPKPDRCRG